MKKIAFFLLSFSISILGCKEQEKIAPKSGIPWVKMDGRIVLFSAEIVSVIDGGAKRIDTILRKPKQVPYQIYGSHGVSSLGDRIVYTVYKSNPINFSASVWSMKPDGSENLPALPTPVYTMASPSINKNGHIAYTANFGWLKPMSLWVDENKICSFNDFLGGILRNHLSWHPKEEKLLMSLANYAKGNLTASLYELNVTDTIPKLLLDAPVDTRYYYASYSPDGRKIAFNFETNSLGRQENYICVVNADGSQLEKIKAVDFYTYIAWAPTGNRIVYNIQEGIHIMNIDGSDDTLIIKGYSDRMVWIK